jgi:hypothetical protein
LTRVCVIHVMVSFFVCFFISLPLTAATAY